MNTKLETPACKVNEVNKPNKEDNDDELGWDDVQYVRTVNILRNRVLKAERKIVLCCSIGKYIAF